MQQQQRREKAQLEQLKKLEKGQAQVQGKGAGG
jgi:hypothetical protein